MSKFQTAGLIEEAYQAGLRDFAENYVQSLEDRRSTLAHLSDARWHLIGHLQSNKVKSALQIANVFHALDSEKLFDMISKRLKETPTWAPWPVFIEVNIDAEPQKAGISPEMAFSLVERVLGDRHLSLLGFMCVPRADGSLGQLRESFVRMRLLRDKVQEDLKNKGINQPLLLNMGMSGDFEVAIEEGADWVRLGTILFGERAPRT